MLKPTLWTWPEAIGLISVWVPPEGIRLWFSVFTDPCMLCVSMIYEHGGKATIQIDPTTPLDRLAKSLNVMAHRLVCCYEYRSYSARLRTQLRVAEHNFSARLFSVRLGHELRAERRRKR